VQSSYKWWHEPNLEAVKNTIARKQKEATKRVEHDRYVKALQALIYDKGQGGVSEWRERFFESMEANLGASNSQYYKNQKAYERAMRDILHCCQSYNRV
jgi:succinate dehydrogenase/fumarate reductase flavoprotein subunit